MTAEEFLEHGAKLRAAVLELEHQIASRHAISLSEADPAITRLQASKVEAEAKLADLIARFQSEL